MEEESDQQEDALKTFQSALSLLNPNEDGKVHKDKLKEYLTKTLGALFEEDMTSFVLDHMKADENGMISVEGFMEAFSTEYWTPESLAAMQNVLENAPHLVRTMVDWKNVLGNLGVDLTEDEMGQLISSARKCAADLLSSQIKKNNSNTEQDAGGESRPQILSAVQDQLHLLEIGANNCKTNLDEHPEGQ